MFKLPYFMHESFYEIRNKTKLYFRDIVKDYKVWLIVLLCILLRLDTKACYLIQSQNLYFFPFSMELQFMFHKLTDIDFSHGNKNNVYFRTKSYTQKKNWITIFTFAVLYELKRISLLICNT